MDITMLLADHVQAADNKLNMLGGGWTVTEGEDRAVPFGIGLVIRVPWARSNEKIMLTLRLLDEDGAPVQDSEGAVKIDIELEVGRPPGLPHGVDLDQVIAINSGPLQLPRGKRYAWVCQEKDTTLASCRFMTRPSQR